MHIGRRIGVDEPDPALARLERIRRQMPVPIYGLVPQRHLEDWGALGVQNAERNGVFEECTISISYTLWRNPEYIDDPVNRAELDDERLARLDELPPDRPAWLIERTRRMRYPLLWECVMTHWRAEPRDDDRVEALLVAHVNHVLANKWLQSGPLDVPESPVDERHVERVAAISVNGFSRPGIRIDTDPDVYGVGFALDNGSRVTAVVPRDELPLIDLAFATRTL